MLKNFLRPYVEVRPHTWSKYLILAEFTANNAVNTSTGYSPFVLNAGEPTTLPKSLVVPQSMSSNQGFEDVLCQMKEVLEIAQPNVAQAQERTMCQVNKARYIEEWKEADQVLLSTGDLCIFAMHLPMKLKRH